MAFVADVSRIFGENMSLQGRIQDWWPGSRLWLVHVGTFHGSQRSSIIPVLNHQERFILSLYMTVVNHRELTWFSQQTSRTSPHIFRGASHGRDAQVRASGYGCEKIESQQLPHTMVSQLTWSGKRRPWDSDLGAKGDGKYLEMSQTKRGLNGSFRVNPMISVIFIRIDMTLYPDYIISKCPLCHLFQASERTYII